MQINNSNIDEYLDRFFEGRTTCAEESEMMQYFRTSEVPERLEAYKPMFAWIESGMPESDKEVKPKRPTIIWKTLTWWLSAAAVVAILVSVAMTFEPQSGNQSISTLEALYRGSYVENNGVRNSNIAAIMPEIKSTLEAVDEMEYEIANMNFENIEVII